MKKKILVIGLGRFGLNVVKSLTNMNADFLAIDIDQERVAMASEFTQYCEICDTTKLDVLEEIDAASFETAIVAIGSLQSTILTVANLSELGVKRIYCRLESSEYENVIRKLGATDIIIPEISAATSLSHEIVSRNVLDYYEIDKQFGIVQVLIKNEFEPKTLIELDLRNKYDVNIVGILRDDKFFIPKGTDTINPSDTILVVGKNAAVMRFESDINS
ncbi:MAG: TrkA family potassium uptake protein [Acholeplasmatales bacterium]|nr:TrkA family potassium uptake protein [Acholeplasmatales bacterium]